MVWARQAKREGRTQVNQWLKPRNLLAGSKLVDMGRFTVHAPVVGATPRPGSWLRPGGRVEGLRRRRGDAVGVKLAASLVERSESERGNPPDVAHCCGGQDPLSVDGVGWGRSLRSSRGMGKPGTWRREAANPLSGTWRPRAAGEYRRPASLSGSGDQDRVSYQPGCKARCLRWVRGEPGAVKVARRVRRAARRNPPTERPTGRSWSRQSSGTWR